MKDLESLGAPSGPKKPATTSALVLLLTDIMAIFKEAAFQNIYWSFRQLKKLIRQVPTLTFAGWNFNEII